MEKREKILNLLVLGREDYHTTYELQREYLTKRREGKVEDTLILVEHPPVITIGGGGTREHLLQTEEELKREGIEVLEIDRGGDITYHGPGQLVGYPILHLDQHKRDLHWVLRSYEEVFMRLLHTYGLVGERIEGLTGLFIKGEKILAIGIGAKHWITFHGFAFNLDPDLHHFAYIVPCGIKDRGVTSLQVVLGARRPHKKDLQEALVKEFMEVFSFTHVVTLPVKTL